MADLSDDDLKPCPFCGGTPKMSHNNGGPDDPNAGAYWVECTNCGASTNLRFSCGEDCRPLLAEAWNRRALNAPQAAPVGEPAKWVNAMCALVSEWGSAHHQMHIHMAAGRVEDSLLAARYRNDVMREIERCLSLAATHQADPVAPAEPGWMPRALMAEQVLREIAEHVSQSGDHTPESFRRGLVSLMTPTHKILRAAAAPHPATAGNGQGAEATHGEPGGPRA